LGDVAQSMIIFNEIAYIVVNNSNKIEVVDAKTFKKQSTITLPKSPRYMLAIGSKAYVSTISFNNTGEIYVIDLNTNTIVKTIKAQGWTEQMLIVNNQVLVANPGGKQIYFLNTTNNTITDSVSVLAGGYNMVRDENNKVWVLCDGIDGYDTSGNPIRVANAAFYKLNPLNKTIENQLTFAVSNIYPSKLIIDNTKQNLYFLNNDIYKFNINDVAIPNTPYITAGSDWFYGIGLDFRTNNLYVGVAVYNAAGSVRKYTGTNLVKTIPVGIYPGDFCFN
jgi:hypothetical protein